MRFKNDAKQKFPSKRSSIEIAVTYFPSLLLALLCLSVSAAVQAQPIVEWEEPLSTEFTEVGQEVEGEDAETTSEEESDGEASENEVSEEPLQVSTSDYSARIASMKERNEALWTRAKKQFEKGFLTMNEHRRLAQDYRQVKQMLRALGPESSEQDFQMAQDALHAYRMNTHAQIFDSQIDSKKANKKKLSKKQRRNARKTARRMKRKSKAAGVGSNASVSQVRKEINSKLAQMKQGELDNKGLRDLVKLRQKFNRSVQAASGGE